MLSIFSEKIDSLVKTIEIIYFYYENYSWLTRDDGSIGYSYLINLLLNVIL